MQNRDTLNTTTGFMMIYYIKLVFPSYHYDKLHVNNQTGVYYTP